MSSAQAGTTTTAGYPGSGVVEWFDELFASLGSQLLGTVALLVAIALLALALRRVGPWFKERFDDLAVETVQSLTIAVAATAATVALVVIWGSGRTLALVAATLEISPGDVVALVVTVAVVAGSYAVTRVTKRVIGHVTESRSSLSAHHQEVAHHVVQIAVFAVVFLLVLAIWEVNVDSLLLGAGVLSVVLGLAARQTLGAVLAGFVVLFSRPFELGDWIEVDDVEGIVQDITIVNTQLKTFDDEVVMVPNDVVTSSKVINRSRLDRLRVNVDVGVDYGADVSRAADLAEAAMDDLAGGVILEKPDPHVVLTEFGDSAVVLRLRFYIDDPTARRMWHAKTEVIEAVKERFEEAGIEIPFPQRTLDARGEGFAVASERGDSRRADGEE